MVNIYSFLHITINMASEKPIARLSVSLSLWISRCTCTYIGFNGGCLQQLSTSSWAGDQGQGNKPTSNLLGETSNNPRDRLLGSLLSNALTQVKSMEVWVAWGQSCSKFTPLLASWDSVIGLGGARYMIWEVCSWA